MVESINERIKKTLLLNLIWASFWLHSRTKEKDSEKQSVLNYLYIKAVAACWLCVC